ncbi:MAG: hypothetical protein ACK4FF_07165, partial [Limnobacter sp.]|uniref:hypothetical protein n=1 Tax=Limnobacter sp. TaxID=2003368 RepID=UPI00391AA08F
MSNLTPLIGDVLDVEALQIQPPPNSVGLVSVGADGRAAALEIVRDGQTVNLATGSWLFAGDVIKASEQPLPPIAVAGASASSMKVLQLAGTSDVALPLQDNDPAVASVMDTPAEPLVDQITVAAAENGDESGLVGLVPPGAGFLTALGIPGLGALAFGGALAIGATGGGGGGAGPDDS